MMLAAAAVGRNIVTVEGLGDDGELTDLQQAFVDYGAVQCGFCTPGLIVAADHLLSVNPSPTELEIREANSGNLCRCTGYGRVIAPSPAWPRSAPPLTDADCPVPLPMQNLLGYTTLCS